MHQEKIAILNLRKHKMKLEKAQIETNFETPDSGCGSHFILTKWQAHIFPIIHE